MALWQWEAVCKTGEDPRLDPLARNVTEVKNSVEVVNSGYLSKWL